MIISSTGERKYLSPEERDCFLGVCEELTPQARVFCLILVFTGCRISEALELTGERMEFSSSSIVFRTLKQRDKAKFRLVPIPRTLANLLQQFMQEKSLNSSDLLFSWSKTKAWMIVKAAMESASIEGVRASPKGLRHAFAVTAIHSGVPINLVQRWLGHTRIETTAIYANVIGPEERTIAARMWSAEWKDERLERDQ